jgi:hypothetical protein
VSDLVEGKGEGWGTPEEALDALARLVAAALGGAGVAWADPDPAKGDLVLQATPPGSDRAEALLASVRSRRTEPLRIEITAFFADPRAFRGWDVLFRPLSLLPGPSGEAACAVVPDAELRRWLEAASREKAAQVVRFPAGSGLPLQETRVVSACQLSFVSHFEEKDAGGTPVLDPVVACLAHGFSTSLRAIPLGREGGASVLFDISLRKPAKGVRCAVLQMKRMSIHVPNILEKRVAGTVRIPEGTCVVVALGSLGCWGSDPEPPGEGWITFVVLRPVPASGK